MSALPIITSKMVCKNKKEKVKTLILGEIIQIHPCMVSEEVSGVNHMTSHDGMFKVKADGISQEILDIIGGIRVKFSGSSVTEFKKDYII